MFFEKSRDRGVTLEGSKESNIERGEALGKEDERDRWTGIESKYVPELVANASGVKGARGVSGDSRNG